MNLLDKTLAKSNWISIDQSDRIFYIHCFLEIESLSYRVLGDEDWSSK